MKTCTRFSKRLPSAPESSVWIHEKQRRRAFGFGYSIATALAFVLLPIASVRAGANGSWIGTWAASPQPVWDTDFLAPINFPRNLWNQTIRQIARVSIGGKQVRVVLSNEYGSQPLLVGAARVALSDSGSAIKAGSDKVLTFSGNESFSIPPGALIVSDPVELSVPPLGSIAVSLYFPEVTPTTTMHWDGRQTAYIVAGNKVSDTDIRAGFQNRISIILQWYSGRRPVRRARDRDFRRLDYGWGWFHARRQPPLARFTC